VSSLRQRIVVFFTVLLILVLTIAFSWISTSQERIATARLVAELDVGNRVIQHLFAQRSAQLIQAAQVLASDYGFREAIATRDVGTIGSVLHNHGARIEASVVMLFDIDGKILATTLDDAPGSHALPMSDLLATARENDRASAVVPLDGTPFQVVLVPVRAPLPIAWVAMGFALGDPLAEELRRVSGLHVSFLARTHQSAPRLHGSTLAQPLRSALLSQAGARLARAHGTHRILLGDELFESRIAPLGSSAEGTVFAVLQLSLAEGLAPFERLRASLIALGLLSIAVTVAGSMMLARGITRPINGLAQLARQIRDGNYSEHAHIQTQDEIGELGLSFNHMLDAIEAREGEILRLAYRDTLTDLPNRARFKQLLADAIAAASENRRGGCVLLLDIDRFKHVNDTLGHPVGDQVLQQVATRLRREFSGNQAVARLGGDEFAIVVPRLDEEDVFDVARRVSHVLAAPIEIAGQAIDISASAGAAQFPRHSDDVSMLLRQADVAMYTAKRRRTEFVLYDASFEYGRQTQLSLLGELRRAVEESQLQLHYQPKLNLRTGAALQAEALVRWTHPDRGMVPPAEFIPFAEQTGYIRQVTHWVLHEAVRQCSEWRRAGMQIALSVNISARDLVDAELVRHVQRTLAVHDVPPQMICLEITESGFIDDPQRALDILNALHGLGLRLAIDDFGTGYSSLAYLKKLPVQELKIDRTFVKNMVDDPDDSMIVRSTIDLGHAMGMEVVAEGVEDAASLHALQRLGCDLVQGYFVSKPLAAAPFLAWQQARQADLRTEAQV